MSVSLSSGVTLDDLVTSAIDPVTGMISFSAGSGSGYLTFSGAQSSSVVATGDTISPLSLPACSPVGFTVTANAGVSSLIVAIQGATDAAQTNWVTLGVVTLSAPGYGAFNSMLNYSGYRANVINIAGGSCSVKASGRVFNSGSVVTNPVYTGIPVSGPNLVYSSSSAVSVIAPVAWAFGSYSNNGGKVKLTSSVPHGLTTSPAVGASVFSVFSGGAMAGVSGLYKVLSVDSTTEITIDLAHSAGLFTGAAITIKNVSIAMSSITVPGGCIGPSGKLTVDADFSSNGSSTGRYIQVALGTTSMFSAVPDTGWSAYRLLGKIKNRGAQNANYVIANNKTGFGYGGAVYSTSVDTSVAQVLYINACCTLGNEVITLEGYDVTVYPA